MQRFFMIAFFMEMRKGEIYALTWNDIDFDKGIIKVTKSLAQKLKGGDRITPPKNASSIRDIEFPVPLKIALEEHLARCKELKGFKSEWFVCGEPKRCETAR